MFEILAISGSLRAHSSNTEVLRAAAALAPESMHITIYSALDSAAILATPQLTALLHSALDSLASAITDQRGRN